MLDTVKINHVQHISFTQSRLTDAVSVILSELLSYEHPSKPGAMLLYVAENSQSTLTTIFGILAISCAAMAVRISSGTM